MRVIPGDFQEKKIQMIGKKLGTIYRLPREKEQRLSFLNSKHKQETLSLEEKIELDNLLDEYDNLTFMRAKALEGIK